MTLLNLVVLAVVQGITEFLPISSSGHLILVPMLTDWPDQGLMIDVAVHAGTLLAVMLYFWRDVGAMIAGLWRFLQGRRDAGAKLAGLVLAATLTVAVAGFLLLDLVAGALRGIEVIAWATLGFGILLYAADRLGMRVRRIEHMGLWDAVAIGCAQVLALIPGASRAGVTMTMARFLGYERAEAARFSMLLSIPTVAAAAVLMGHSLYRAGDVDLGIQAGVAAGLSFLSAILAIAVMMAWLRRATFTPFVVYRVCLGLVLLGIAYGNEIGALMAYTF